MKTLFATLALTLSLAAAPMVDFQEPKIGIQNTILAKVNGKTISMIDVKKKMDMAFHQGYPQLAHSNQARFQFYEASWKHVLMDMIDQELMISDAEDKEIKVTDGEIREILEERFAPNVTQTLDKIGLTFDEACKMIKNEIIVQRMSWWFIHSKAVGSVTPQDIRQAYRLYLEAHPAYTDWKYRVVTIRTDSSNESLAEEVYKALAESGKSPEAVEVKQIEGAVIAVSNEFNAKTEELSDIHKASLLTIEPGQYSKPSYQLSRADKKGVYRIFYLIAKNDVAAPAFEDMSTYLKNELIQKAVTAESQVYINKLRKHYGFDAETVIPEELHPFSLQ
jgi:hypothetical protein